MRRLAVTFVLFSLMVISTTSCTGVRQINQLAIVAAVGLDLGEKPGTIRLSAQIIRPADARGQTGAPSGGTGQPIYSVSAEGKTIFEAIRNLGRFTSRRVYWAHNFLIVMHEDYARKGINDMVDFFTRNHELRMSTWVAVTPNRPDEVIATITGLEVVPGEAVDRLFSNNHIVGQAPASNMMNLEETHLNATTQSLLARLQLVPRGISNKKPEEHGSIKQVELAGSAAFHDDKMVGWLTTKETRGVLFFLERLDNGIEVVSCPEGDEKISLEFHNARLKVEPFYRQSKPQFNITLKTDADIVESGCNSTLTGKKHEITQKLEQQLKQRVESAVDKAKQYHTDILKLGEIFHNKYPQEWRTLGPRWDTIFSELEPTIQVKASIKSTVVKVMGTKVK
ncbi:Ger(x)C family spore germination protein [Paenibacillus kobensis]|uniref:Ger(x)C family spore germination protein n=1 Tax=Paenibacillus kobensis TaxID=59841 RepID=UPI000FD9EA3A|nr:Ger(x)C family spore germination protein [Paenibacillus kobensis]